MSSHNLHCVTASQVAGKITKLSWTPQAGDKSCDINLALQDGKTAIDLTIEREGAKSEQYNIVTSREARVEEAVFVNELGQYSAVKVDIEEGGHHTCAAETGAVILEGNGSVHLGEHKLVVDDENETVFFNGQYYREGDTIEIGGRTAIINTQTLQLQ